MRRLFSGRRAVQKTPGPNDQSAPAQNIPAGQVRLGLNDNLQVIKNAFGESRDVVFRDLVIDGHHPAAIIYIDGLVDREMINRDILRPIMSSNQPSVPAGENPTVSVDSIKSRLLNAGQIEASVDTDAVIAAIIAGNVALLIKGSDHILLIDAKGWEKRAIEKPEKEVSIRGPKDSFTETLLTNMALLRRRIKDPQLTFKTVQVGQRTKSEVTVAFIKGVAPDSLIDEITLRLGRIDTDAILDVGYIEQYIEDQPSAFFPTIGTTERPDVAAACILEGRAAILADGSPAALTMPFMFMEAFQNPDDYYNRPFFASLGRWLRFLAFFLSLNLPGIFVALESYHPELIPTELLISLAAAREGLPFPAVLEAFLMLITFEILREAGVRLPRPVGQAVNIVGALVIGQVAVTAGIVGAAMVIVLSATAIASFIVVPYTESGVYLRLLITIASGFLGLYAVVLINIELLSHLASLRSFGVSYLSPLTPFNAAGLKDVLVRAPLWSMDDRPRELHPGDDRRQAPGNMPAAPKAGTQ